LKAIILAGGFGTRLRPLSCTRPKQLFPIANRPLLDWILEGLSKSGVTEVILAVNYMADVLQRYFGNYRYEMKIMYSRETKPLGTGGPIKNAEKILKADGKFFILNGDVLTNIQYSNLEKNHAKYRKKYNSTLTITLYEVEDPSRFGVVEIGPTNRIYRFVEKPKLGEEPSKLINAGAYLTEPEIIDYIPSDKCSIERDVFPSLAQKGKMYGFKHEGLWIDIGKPDDFVKANFSVMDIIAKDKPKIGIDTQLSSGVKIIPPAIVGNEVKVGQGTHIGPYVTIGDNVSIGNGCKISHSILFNNSWVDSYSSINGAIVGEGAVVGQWVKIENNCILGDYAVISDNVTFTKGVSVCPSKEVGESILEPKQVM
jgi:mannose-1-phosphate guanylyltransferase